MEDYFLYLYSMKKNEAHFLQFVGDYAGVYERFYKEMQHLQRKYEKFPFATDVSVVYFAYQQAIAFQAAEEYLVGIYLSMEKRRKDIHEQVRAYQTTFEKLNKALREATSKLEKEKNASKRAGLEVKGKTAFNELTYFEAQNYQYLTHLKALTQYLWDDVRGSLTSAMTVISYKVGESLSVNSSTFSIKAEYPISSYPPINNGIGIAPVLCE